ncbi:SMI1/KNR4 family protein [Alkalihalophilus marmarensis]|uniref:Knr4/Smi1-like domain-containing protein n=1 Tax=Alkalihalophilus marmarensis DSM 21297 TaxID=1188261 RepID=U6SQF3_9BACI|nr:SMI1/KNR4 family protein [Alkalihalophilus marmarensis]ERN53939.1 hypothetical protein A33I_09045 [Alkalihalophilus marmarensis DSM 21297]MCM3491108.1 SMI1/KNR4 family protein [Alkalihalophilus marmarensis]
MKYIHIWQEDNDYGKLEPLTDEMVKKVEDDLGIKLPHPYIQLLKQQNGGYLIFNAHPKDVPTSWAPDHVNVNHLFGIGMGTEKGILDSSYLIQEWDLPENIVLISGDGHAWIALDYRNTKSEPFLMCCAEGENKGMIEDDYLDEVLQELSTSKNKDVKEFALYSLEQLQNRIHK